MKKPKPRPRNADATQKRILEAAKREFSRLGLGGARVDAIAAARQGQQAHDLPLFRQQGSSSSPPCSRPPIPISAWPSGRSSSKSSIPSRPSSASSASPGITIWHNPEFLTLVNSENLHKARHLKNSAAIRDSAAPLSA